MIAVTVQQQIYNELKRQILDGEYDLGDRINIDAVCKTLKVSNSPVREALTLLVKDKLVTLRPNAGAFVVNFDKDSYENIAGFIDTLLLGAYEMCTRQGREQLLASHMKRAMQQLESSAGLSDRERMRRILMFERCFAAATENPTTIGCFDDHFDLLFLAAMFNHKGRTIDWDNNIRLDRELIAAVEKKQHTAVQDLLCRHSIMHCR